MITWIISSLIISQHEAIEQINHNKLCCNTTMNHNNELESILNNNIFNLYLLATILLISMLVSMFFIIKKI